MKKLLIYCVLLPLIVLLAGCTQPSPQVVATTQPVYDFTVMLCQGTDLSVGQLVTESVSCLHDYTLQVRQMRMLEAADTIVISGAGLEDFLSDVLVNTAQTIDASQNISIFCGDVHQHHDEQSAAHNHNHVIDPHIWLSPENAKIMSQNICAGLAQQYPAYSAQFAANLTSILLQLDNLQSYGVTALSGLSTQEMITFHDGFHYFAEAFGLHILQAVEEESGSEASAGELKELITLVRDNQLPAVFTEVSGSVSAADVIAAEAHIAVYPLDMAMSDRSYFDAMYHNIDTVKEALG